MYSCFFGFDKSELSPLNDFMVAMFVLKKSSETLPLCPKRRDHSIMKNMMMLQHITRIHHHRNYWLLYLLTIYCWYNQLFHHKLDSVSYYASPETGCYHPVVDCVYSLIVVFLYRVDNGKTLFTWLLLFKPVLVMLFGATRTEASLKRLAVRGLQQPAAWTIQPLSHWQQ